MLRSAVLTRDSEELAVPKGQCRVEGLKVAEVRVLAKEILVETRGKRRRDRPHVVDTFDEHLRIRVRVRFRVRVSMS